MNESTREAVFCYRTGPVSELGGHILLIGACRQTRTSFEQKSVRENLVIFPDKKAMLANRIISVTEDEDDPFFTNVDSEAERLLKVAKCNLFIWARKESPHLLDEIREAIREGEKITKEAVLEMHFLGLLGQGFYSLKILSKIPLLSSWAKSTSNLRDVHHSAESF